MKLWKYKTSIVKLVRYDGKDGCVVINSVDTIRISRHLTLWRSSDFENRDAIAIPSRLECLICSNQAD